ncbi:atos homolog atossa isoform 1-T5 [Cochliomyia hominivorax]
MIPTSATSSSPPTASVGSIGTNQMNNSPNISGTANTNNGAAGVGGGSVGSVVGQANLSAFLGIASLILEGRALADDEYAPQTTRHVLSGNATIGDCGRQSPKPSTSRAAFGDNYGGSGSNTTTTTINAMTNSFSIDLANYLGRKSSNSPDTTSSSSFLRDYYSSSGESAASSVESNHSRWSQKLSQLRQESPNAHHQVLAARQKIAVDCARGSEAEYVALAINTDHQGGGGNGGLNDERRGGDFEILRRMSINQMNFYNSPNSVGSMGGGGVGGGSGGGGSSENFMCSLQSLASNTCLRVGNPLLVTTTSPPRYSNSRQISSSSSSRFITPSHHQQQLLDNSPNSSKNSSSSSTNSWYPATSPPPQISNSGSTSNSSHNKDYLLRKSTTAAAVAVTTQRMPIPSATPIPTANNKSSLNTTNSQNQHSNIFHRNSFSTNLNSNNATTVSGAAGATTIATSTPTAAAIQRNQTYPQQGPHCDQFLRKMGLAKGDALETEEHHCDMSYVNITCTRWRAYCIKMENILARGEPICIEVYLGPVGHKILLEQWIITQKDKQPPPTMTLPSLCSAIRSQLYFSQISAWCDLIKKSDKTIYETGRVIFTTPPTTSAAGDLATTNNVIQPQTAATLLTTSTHYQQQQHTISGLAPSTSASGTGMLGTGVSSGVGCNKRRPSSSAPRLNIFYRIKQYDSTACFNSKPNVHNFPNVNITENCSISVCLKSLPRITGGIPKIGTTTATATQQQQQQQQISPSAAVTTTPATVNTLTVKNTNKTTDTKTAAASSAVATTTSNANKSTILTMNCDNNLKELQQQQQNKTLTASLRCTFSQKRNNSKSSPTITTATTSQLEHNLKDQQQHAEEDVDLEYEEHHYIDITAAGGDNSNISASSSLIASSVCGDGDCDVGGNSVGDCDSSNSSFSTNNCGNLSHREKQLLKYRKRMMKRDKKQQLRKTNEITVNKLQNDNKMEQGEDDIDDEVEEDIDNEIDGDNMKHINEGNNSDNTAGYNDLIKYSINNTKLAKGQRQQEQQQHQQQQQQEQLPNNHINNNSNSIPCTTTATTTTIHVKMISTGTQTITNTCTACGSEKSMICLKCNPFKTTTTARTTIATAITKTTSTPTTNSLYNYDEEQMDAETLSSASNSSSSSASSLSSSDIIHTPRNKAELLLQAIQRTPKSNKKHKNKSKDSQQQQQQMAAIKQHQQQQPLQPQHSPSSSTSSLINSTIKINRKSSPNSSQLNDNSNNSNNLNNGVVSNTNNINNSRNNNININSNSNNSNNITMIGCQVCKRQKTQHHFNQTSMIEELSSSDDNNSLAHGSFNSISNGIDAQQALNATVNQNPTAVADDCGATDGDDEDGDNEKDGGSILSNDCVDNISYVIEENDVQLHENGVERKMSKTKSSSDDFNEHEIMEEEYFETSTKLTPHIDRCSLNNKTYYEQLKNSNATDTIDYQTRSCSTPPLEEHTRNINGCSGNSCNETTAMMAQFKTPTPSEQQQNVLKNKAKQQQQPLQPHKPNLLHIACNFNKNDEQSHHQLQQQQQKQQQQQISKLNHLNTMDNSTPTTSHNPLLLRRSLPKVNLTPIFCNPNSTMMVVSSSPIPIGNGVSNGTAETNGLISKSAEINITQASPTFSFESPSSPAPSITVQKSNSAPTLPNSPSLSPRFFKASAIYKRRSRHLSDRSDRSSLGSDEQFSDEDIDSGMYSPFATSPVKLKTRLAAVFGRKPLLGNLEECLLQRRLVPKIEVMGFKLLLGASGGFCPTQLTIPAAAYFYELKGETLSTPYLCEIRLPRKGYTVPRCGTVQATLLNPMGTVVRMFVIPYDMRDMPTLHQTFIRQRILADTGVQSNNNGEDVKQNDIGNDEKHFDVDLNSKSSQDLGQHQQQQQQQVLNQQQQQRSPQCNNENNLGHFISAENMKSLRYSIHLRFQTSRSGRLMLHTDIRLLISRRTDCDTAAAHAKGVLEAPNELITNTVMPTNPKYSARQDQTSSKI